jgi:hypothetical protein
MNHQMPLPGYREFVDLSAILGLKGSQRIVLDELNQILQRGGDASVMKLSVLTNYHYYTVWRALRDLREIGLIAIAHPKNGAPAQYSITVEV